MSIVDTWDWDKLNPEELEEPFEVDAHMKVQAAIYDFENDFGIRPNRIIIGHHLLDEIVDTFYDKNFTMKTLEEAVREQNLGMICKYEGIPVKVDYDNPDILEVGYMAKRIWGK